MRNIVLIVWACFAFGFAPMTAALAQTRVATVPAAGAERSAYASWRVGEAPPSIATLLTLARDADAEARRVAALHLGELEAPDETAVAALVELMGDADRSVRQQAVASLMRDVGPATPALAARLTERHPTSGGPQSRVLASFEPFDASMLAAAVLLHGSNVDGNALLDADRRLMTTLQRRRERGRGAVPLPRRRPPLGGGAASLHGSDPLAAGRGRLLHVLARLPLAPGPAVLAALRAGDEPRRNAIVAALDDRPEALLPALPALTSILVEDPDGAAAVARLIGQIPNVGSNVLRALQAHASASVRRRALLAYERADRFEEMFGRAILDPDPSVRGAALTWARRRLSGEPCGGGEPERLDEPAFAALTAATRSSDARRRALAIHVLADYACRARRPEVERLATALVDRLDDASPEVATAAARRLADLAGFGLAPPGEHAGSLVRRALEAPSGERRGLILSALATMELAGPQRTRVTGMAVEHCLADQSSFVEAPCAPLERITKHQADGADGVLAALLRRLPNLDLDQRALALIERYAQEAEAFERVLDQLLRSSDPQRSSQAGLILAKLGARSPDILDALETLARGPLPPGAYWLGSRVADAAWQLASFGPSGEERLARLVADEAVGQEIRYNIVIGPLASADGAAARQALLALGEGEDHELRAAALSVLGASALNDASLRRDLIARFDGAQAEVREAIAFAWLYEGLPAAPMVDRLVADPLPAVRVHGLHLLERLPPDDGRRTRLLDLALSDPDPPVRDVAATVEIRLADPARLLRRLARGDPLDWDWALQDALKRLPRLTPELSAALAARVDYADLAGSRTALTILAHHRARDAVDLDALRTALRTRAQTERRLAADVLFELGENPFADGGLIAAVFIDRIVEDTVAARISDAADGFGPPEVNAADLAVVGVGGLPRFPWPPPPGYRRVVVDKAFFGEPEGAELTKGAVYDALVGAIEAASDNFEHGLFGGPPGGFALVARMERVRPDGTPVPEPGRWIEEGTPRFSLWELLGDLFFEAPGHFRVIVFALTDDLTPGSEAGARVPDPREGAAAMPSELAEEPVGDTQVLALVYSFQRARNAQLQPWEDGAPSARRHLQLAGVWSSLDPR